MGSAEAPRPPIVLSPSGPSAQGAQRAQRAERAEGVTAGNGKRGVFIVFEGSDASGKSTQVRLLASRLEGLGITPLVTREPGGTSVGARIRSLVLDHSDEGAVLSARAEALLMAADRAQHASTVLRPALDAGRVVLCDRYIGSSIVYQGIGRGLGASDVEQISLWATEHLVPARTVVIQVPLATVTERLGTLGTPDRLESLGPCFLELVTEGYSSLLTRPDTVGVLGTGSPEEVAARVWSSVEDLF